MSSTLHCIAGIGAHDLSLLEFVSQTNGRLLCCRRKLWGSPLLFWLVVIILTAKPFQKSVANFDQIQFSSGLRIKLSDSRVLWQLLMKIQAVVDL